MRKSIFENENDWKMENENDWTKKKREKKEREREREKKEREEREREVGVPDNLTLAGRNSPGCRRPRRGLS